MSLSRSATDARVATILPIRLGVGKAFFKARESKSRGHTTRTNTESHFRLLGGVSAWSKSQPSYVLARVDEEQVVILVAAQGISRESAEVSQSGHTVSFSTPEREQAVTRAMGLTALRGLKPRWNGYGALPIPDNVVDRVQGMLLTPILVARPPTVVPTGRESIQFEYHGDGGAYLEIEVFADRLVTYWEKGEDDFLEEAHDDWERATELIQRFHA